MSVIYSSFDSREYSGDCTICLEPLQHKYKPAVAHSEGGDLHPLHRECAQSAARVSSLCPLCRREIDRDSVFTWKDRCVVKLKEFLSISGKMASASLIVVLVAGTILIPAISIGLIVKKSGIVDTGLKSIATGAVSGIFSLAVNQLLGNRAEVVSAYLTGITACVIIPTAYYTSGPAGSWGVVLGTGVVSIPLTAAIIAGVAVKSEIVATVLTETLTATITAVVMETINSEFAAKTIVNGVMGLLVVSAVKVGYDEIRRRFVQP